MKDSEGSVRLDIRVTPRASKNAIDGMRNGTLIVRVTAPPVDSAANEAVIELLARTIGVPKRNITISRGAAGRNKTVAITGVSSADLMERFPK